MYTPADSQDVEKKLARSLTGARVQSLSDNIFAFAMTLLTFNLIVPLDLPHEHLDHLFLTLWPQFLTYFMSFTVLAAFWVGTHNIFHWMKHLDRKSLWISVLFLSFITLIPFTTGILRNYYTEQIAIIAYGTNLIVCGLALYWFWVHATNRRLLIHEDVSDDTIAIMKFRILLPVLCAIPVTGFAIVSPVVSLFMFAGLFLLTAFPIASDKIAAATGLLGRTSVR